MTFLLVLYLIAIPSASIAILCAPHHLASGKGYFPKTIWLDNGRVVDYGDTAEVLGKYRSNYGRSLEERQTISAAAVSLPADA